MDYRVLTPEQREQFLSRGYIVLHDCIDRDFAQKWIDRAWIRLGYDPNDPTTWQQGRIHMPTNESIEVKTFAPKVWDAACELLGGEERVERPYHWSDAFIVNLHEGAGRPWQAPSAEVKGWHKDGDFFRHFLDSPEQGLLTLILWSDVESQGGATFVAADSVPVITRYLVERPEGVLPNEFPFRDLIRECHDFVEITGRFGDVVLLHPYMLHASSQNHRRVPRFLTNPPIKLKEPMNFNQPNPSDYFLVEQSILCALGVEKLDYRPTSPREHVIPERERCQEKMLQEEKARLTAAKVN